MSRNTRRLRQSNQSLASRGLPINKKENPRKTEVLQSTDSDIIESLNCGLERCTSLLGAMMNSTDDAYEEPQKKEPKKRVKVVSPPKKRPSKISPTKKTAYNKRLVSSTPLLKKGQIKNTPKQKIVKGVAVLRKDDIADSDALNELIQERDNLKTYLKGVLEQKAHIEKEYNVLLESQRSTEHTKLDCYKSCANKFQATLKQTPEKPYDEVPKVSKENDQLSALENLMRSITEKLSVVDKTKESTDASGQILQDRSIRQYSTQDSKIHGGSGKRGNGFKLNSSFIQKQTLKNGGEKYPITTCNDNSPENTSNSIPHKIHTGDNVIDCETQTPVKASFENDPSTNTSKTRHFNTSGHSSIHKRNSPSSIQHSPRLPQYVNQTQEQPNLFQSVNQLQGQSHVQITTLSYLLKELHRMLGGKYDLELNRLLLEIDHIVGQLPFIMSNSLGKNSMSSQNGVVEFLQAENEDLKRQLKLASKTLKTIEELKDVTQMKNNVDLENAQNKIKELNRELSLEEKTKLQLSNQITEVCKVTEDLRKENQSLLQSLSDKDMHFIQEKQIWLNQKSKYSKELSELQESIDQMTVSAQTLEKEKKIFDITMKQKDAEIERLLTLNKDLQNSVSTLLTDIKTEREKHQNLLVADQQTQNAKRHTSRKIHQNQINNYGINKNEHANTKDSLASGKDFRINRGQIQYKCEENIDYSKRFMDDVKSLNELSSITPSSTNSYTNSSVSTLKTFDNIDFQNDLIHLDAKIDVFENMIHKKEREFNT